METINICQINDSTPFSPPQGMGIGYPMAPLVSVRKYKDEGVDELEIRIIAFIDANNVSLIEVADNLIPGEFEGEHELLIDVSYNRSMNGQDEPSEYVLWLVQCHYRPHEGVSIAKVSTTLTNEDPRTSRGTVTHVPRIKS